MSSAQTVTDVSPVGHVATHEVGFSGIPGMTFLILTVSFIFFLVGFSSIGWQKMPVGQYTTDWVGLWKSCRCGDYHFHAGQAWFHGSQALFVLAFLLMLTSLVLMLLYMFVPRVKKSVVLTVFCVFIFTSFLFLLIGISVFGAKTLQKALGSGNQSYSFILTVVAMIFTLGTGVLSIFHIRTTGMF